MNIVPGEGKRGVRVGVSVFVFYCYSVIGPPLLTGNMDGKYLSTKNPKRVL